MHYSFLQALVQVYDEKKYARWEQRRRAATAALVLLTTTLVYSFSLMALSGTHIIFATTFAIFGGVAYTYGASWFLTRGSIAEINDEIGFEKALSNPGKIPPSLIKWAKRHPEDAPAALLLDDRIAVGFLREDGLEHLVASDLAENFQGSLAQAVQTTKAAIR